MLIQFDGRDLGGLFCQPSQVYILLRARVSEVHRYFYASFNQVMPYDQTIAAVVALTDQDQHLSPTQVRPPMKNSFSNRTTGVLHHLIVCQSCCIGCFFNRTHLFNRDDLSQASLLKDQLSPLT